MASIAHILHAPTIRVTSKRTKDLCASHKTLKHGGKYFKVISKAMELTQKLDTFPHRVTSDQAQEEPWRGMFVNWLANWLMLIWFSYTVQVHLPGNGATYSELYLPTAISNQDHS